MASNLAFSPATTLQWTGPPPSFRHELGPERFQDRSRNPRRIRKVLVSLEYATRDVRCNSTVHSTQLTNKVYTHHSDSAAHGRHDVCCVARSVYGDGRASGVVCGYDPPKVDFALGGVIRMRLLSASACRRIQLPHCRPCRHVGGHAAYIRIAPRRDAKLQKRSALAMPTVCSWPHPRRCTSFRRCAVPAFAPEGRRYGRGGTRYRTSASCPARQSLEGSSVYTGGTMNAAPALIVFSYVRVESGDTPRVARCRKRRIPTNV
jgi:hypothetical protein